MNLSSISRKETGLSGPPAGRRSCGSFPGRPLWQAERRPSAAGGRRPGTPDPPVRRPCRLSRADPGRPGRPSAIPAAPPVPASASARSGTNGKPRLLTGGGRRFRAGRPPGRCERRSTRSPDRIPEFGPQELRGVDGRKGMAAGGVQLVVHVHDLVRAVERLQERRFVGGIGVGPEKPFPGLQDRAGPVSPAWAISAARSPSREARPVWRCLTVAPSSRKANRPAPIDPAMPMAWTSCSAPDPEPSRPRRRRRRVRPCPSNETPAPDAPARCTDRSRQPPRSRRPPP